MNVLEMSLFRQLFLAMLFPAVFSIASAEEFELDERKLYKIEVGFYPGIAPFNMPPDKVDEMSSKKVLYSDVSIRDPVIFDLYKALKGNVNSEPFDIDTKFKFVVTDKSGRNVVVCYADRLAKHGQCNGKAVVFDEKLKKWLLDTLDSAFRITQAGCL